MGVSNRHTFQYLPRVEHVVAAFESDSKRASPFLILWKLEPLEHAELCVERNVEGGLGWIIGQGISRGRDTFCHECRGFEYIVSAKHCL